MESYKQEFIEFMVDSNVLKFGDFTLKSGRKSPFFMNAGAYVTGTQLRRLGEYYAKAIHDNYGLDFDVLFGPAYKGIPLTVATTMAISELYGKDIRYCSNRKEVKDHGDTGILLGSKLKDGDRVVIIEDVTTSGKSIEETFPILKAQADVEIVGLMVSLNRMERGLSSEKSALEEIKEKYGVREIIVENGGDIYADIQENIDIAVFAGPSPLSEKVGFTLWADHAPLGICTSSGTVGPSLSFGKADAVMIICKDCALADTYATAFANEIKTTDDIAPCIEKIGKTKDILAAICIKDDKIGIHGIFDLKLFHSKL